MNIDYVICLYDGKWCSKLDESCMRAIEIGRWDVFIVKENHNIDSNTRLNYLDY
jgi:hypothetical protein